MNADNLNAIDFDAVLEQFAWLAYSAKTADLIRHARPKASRHEISEDLAMAAEALAFEQAGQSVSIGGLSDITKSVKEAKKNMVLLPSQLLEISLFLSACSHLSKAFDKDKYPRLHEIAATLNPCSTLAHNLEKCIDLSGQIRPDATARLQSLDHQLVSARAEASAAARRFVKANENSLMENMTTSISGRICVLLKAADKYKFGGMVHGSSQSGQAFYVEPDVLVRANNEVQSLQMQIEEEKREICRDLSRQVARQADALLSNDESITLLDLALAKGRWCSQHDGCIPVISATDRHLYMEHAVHPLLKKESAVANTYEMKDGIDCLMISGANMGGKTVTLKTIGLFAALAHAGFPVSAHRARVPWFDSFYFDIGDSQSIENDLSTFSGHAKNLSAITATATQNSFVLLDEIGNGTDPAQGAALAQAVLEDLLAKHAIVVTSTHYNDVKAFGKTNPHVLVSSVQFDLETMKPTYKYLPGVSGASFAYDIARQFGLADSILERARDLQRENESELQHQLSVLEKQQQEVSLEKERFDKLIADAHRLQKEAAEQKEKIQKQKERMDASYQQQLDDMLYEKKEEAKQILRDLRKTSRPDHQKIEQMAKLDTLNDQSTQEPKEPEGKPQEIKEGDYVHVASLNNHGEVVSVRKNKAQVLVNGRKVNVSLDQLTLTKKPKALKSPAKKGGSGRSFAPFPLELNIIGMRVEEGIRALDHYLDQATYHNVKNVRIIHGMGTGALRKAVWEDLASQPFVKTYNAAGPSDGGLGATLVELK